VHDIFPALWEAQATRKTGVTHAKKAKYRNQVQRHQKRLQRRSIESSGAGFKMEHIRNQKGVHLYVLGITR
jgi:hypothetical protein